MSQPKDKAQGVAVFVVALGVGVYIAADLGFSGFEFLKRKANEAPKDEIQNAARATTEIKNDLRMIAADVQVKAAELEDVQSKLSSIKLEINSRLAELKKIGKYESRAERSTASRVETVRDELLNQADDSFPKFASFDDVKQAAIAWNLGDYVFEPVTEDGTAFQNFSHNNPFATDSAYLKQIGLRWAQLVSKSAVDLKSKKIAVRFDKADGFNFDRAEVVKNYLAKLVGEKVKIDLQSTTQASVRSSSGIDVLIELNNQQGDQQ